MKKSTKVKIQETMEELGIRSAAMSEARTVPYTTEQIKEKVQRVKEQNMGWNFELGLLFLNVSTFPNNTVLAAIEREAMRKLL